MDTEKGSGWYVLVNGGRVIWLSGWTIMKVLGGFASLVAKGWKIFEAGRPE